MFRSENFPLIPLIPGFPASPRPPSFRIFSLTYVIPCFSPTSLVPEFLLDLRHSLLLPDLPRSGISPWLASFLLLPDLPHSGISPWLASFLLLPDLPHSGISPWLASFLLLPDLPHSGISPWLTSFPDSHRIPLLTKGNHGKSRESFLQTGSLLSHNFMRSSA
jgi:hypothetical protein